jgi:hypothetical protein
VGLAGGVADAGPNPVPTESVVMRTTARAEWSQAWVRSQGVLVRFIHFLRLDRQSLQVCAEGGSNDPLGPSSTSGTDTVRLLVILDPSRDFKKHRPER